MNTSQCLATRIDGLKTALKAVVSILSSGLTSVSREIFHSDQIKLQLMLCDA